METKPENGGASRSGNSAAGTGLEAASKKDEPALVTSLFSRRLAQPLAVLAVKCGVSANAVTVAGGLCWVLSLPLPALSFFCRGTGTGCGPAAAVAPWLAAAVLWCAGYLLDVVDGSVARMTGTSNRAGFFLDYVFHLLFKPAFLFSVGLGLAGGLRSGAVPWMPAAAPAAVLLLAVLSIPANCAAAMCSAELALCDEVACGHLKMLGAAAPRLWLGSDDVAAPTSAKRGSPLRTAKTLVAEIVSYYLQAPFFAFLVAADAILRFVWKIGWMPLTTAGFVAVSLILVARIPLRLVREATRLGKATKCGRAGRAAAALAALLRLALVAMPAVPAVLAGAGAGSAASGLRETARTLQNGAEIPSWVAFSLLPWLAVAAVWVLAALAESASAFLSRRAGDPIHGRYWLRAERLSLVPADVAAAAVGLALAFPCAAGGPPQATAAPAWRFLPALLLAASPLAAIACVASELSAAAHVVCQEIGKGRLGENDPAPGRKAAEAIAGLPDAAPGRPGAKCGGRCAAPLTVIFAPWAFPLAVCAGFSVAAAAFAFVCVAMAASLPGRVARAMAVFHASPPGTIG